MNCMKGFVICQYAAIESKIILGKLRPFEQLEEYTRKDDLKYNLSKSYYVMPFPKRFESHESIQYIIASITRGFTIIDGAKIIFYMT